MNLGRERIFLNPLMNSMVYVLFLRFTHSVEHMEENKFLSDKINTVKCIKL